MLNQLAISRAWAYIHMRRLYLHLEFVLIVCGMCATSAARCVPPLALQTKIPVTAETYIQLGNRYADQKQYDCALAAYRAGLKLMPQSANLYYLVGLDLLRKGNFSEAIEPLQRSIELRSDVLKPHLLLATALEQLHRPSEARKQWLAAVNIDPHSERALDGASRNLLSAGDPASVISLLGSTDISNEDLILDLASAYEKVDAGDKAIVVLEKGSQKIPSSVIRQELVKALILQRRFQDAAKIAKEMMQSHPKNARVQELYLHVLVSNDDEQLARPLAAKLLKTEPHDFLVLYLNGLLENRAGNYATARNHLQEATALNPDSYDCHYQLGFALSQLGDLHAAKAEYERALALGAFQPQVRFEYAKVLRKLGETQLAAQQLMLYQKEAKAMANRTAAAIKVGQADRELASGNAKGAAALYREAAAVQPDDAMIEFKLSVALEKIGDRTSEIEVLKKAIQLDPKMAVAHYQLAYLASLQGDFTLAEEQYREAVQAAPRYVEGWIGLAATLATESRITDAQKAVESALHIDPKNANAIELQKELANAAAQSNQ